MSIEDEIRFMPEQASPLNLQAVAHGGVRTISSETVVVEPGDQILLFTDSVTEARRGQEFFGEDRLHEAVRDTDVTLAPSIMDRVRHFAGEKQSDDIALLALCRDNLAAPKSHHHFRRLRAARAARSPRHETYHQ